MTEDEKKRRIKETYGVVNHANILLTILDQNDTLPSQSIIQLSHILRTSR